MKVICYNIWGLPTPFSKDMKKRVSQLSKFLNKEKPDIICLQEVWMYGTLKKLKKELKDYYCTTSEKGIFFNKSGLATFTKTKPVSFKFTKYSNTFERLEERIAGKGFLETTIKTKKGELSIINTHTFARYTKEHDEILKQQFNQLLKYLKNKKNYLLAGDLNMSVKEFLKMKPKYLDYKKPDKPTLYKKNPYKGTFGYLSRGASCDHVAIRIEHHKTKILNHTAVPIYLSDHMPVISTIDYPL